MMKKTNQNRNYTAFDYCFEKTTVRYILMDDTRSMFMLLIPAGMEPFVQDQYASVKLNQNGYPDHRDWLPGSLVHLHLRHHMNSLYDNSFKFGESVKKLKFDRQEVEDGENCEMIKTYLEADEGYGVCHILSHYAGENGFEVKTVFYNHTGSMVTLEMISSASLDNLCPFNTDDGSNNLVFHHFKGGWAMEGKRISETLPQMAMEKAWGGSFESEKFGSIGSMTVCRNYPYAALEDTDHGCTWGMKLKHNATWQLELTRYGVELSLSAGIGDLSYGAWYKNISDGEQFETPAAYIAVARGGIEEVSNDLIEMNRRDIMAYGETGLPIVFNDWCTHWGRPSHDALLRLADRLAQSEVRYFVVDAGWYTGGVGNWETDAQKFPNGLEAFAEEIRARGMIPGIWMEFETVRGRNSARYSADELYIKRNGVPLEGGTDLSAPTKFLDLRNEETIRYLDHAVIEFLKQNRIGYIKIDYNCNIGLGCDGAESLGEGLRQQMSAVYRYLKRIKSELPDIIIENCSMGGARLEPKMMGVTAMSSFSDAHECFELPVIAANMHYLISPCQSQVWCVLKDTYDQNHMQYVIASGFLGRLCWSGPIDKLKSWQFDLLLQAEQFYKKVGHIIKHGRSKLYRTNFINIRNPLGTQAVLRYSTGGDGAMVVYHCFHHSEPLTIELDRTDYEIEASLFPHECRLTGRTLLIQDLDERGNVLYLKSK